MVPGVVKVIEIEERRLPGEVGNGELIKTSDVLMKRL